MEGDAASKDLLEHILRHWTIRDLDIVPGVTDGAAGAAASAGGATTGGGGAAAASGGGDPDAMVCVVNLSIKTVNSKRALSPESFGFECRAFPPMVFAPVEWRDHAAASHVRVVDFPHHYATTNEVGRAAAGDSPKCAPAEAAGMWMHDALLTIDGKEREVGGWGGVGWGGGGGVRTWVEVAALVRRGLGSSRR